jgi:hypothetical protein
MRKLTARGLAGGILCTSIVAWQAFAAGRESGTSIPDFTSIDRPWARASLDFFPPPSGLGPVTYDKAHPQYDTGVNQEGVVRRAPLHLGDLANPNLKPWVVDWIRKANDEVLAGKLRHTSRSNCMPGGVPEFLLYGGPGDNEPVYFIQTPKVVYIIAQADTQVRHVYMNVPHSAHPSPSWYGESVGHYEGDELVVDTIGFNDKSQIDDNYAVPHTTQLHVIERYKVIDNGKTLQASFTVEDPGAFNAPWSAMELFHPTREAALLAEEPCAENNVAYAGDVFPIPIADKPDF